MILPAMGVISEVVCDVRAQNPPSSYGGIVIATLGIAFVGFLTWGHHMFVAGMSTFDVGVFGVLSMFVAIFSAIKVFAWIATLCGGRITFATPMLYVFAFVFLFVFGGMSGVAVATIVARRPLARHLLRRRALPLHHGRRHDHRRSSRRSTTGSRRSPAACTRRRGRGSRARRCRSASSSRSRRSSCSATPACRAATTRIPTRYQCAARAVDGRRDDPRRRHGAHRRRTSSPARGIRRRQPVALDEPSGARVAAAAENFGAPTDATGPYDYESAMKTARARGSPCGS